MKTYGQVLIDLENQITKQEMEKGAARLIMQHVLAKSGSDFFLFLNEESETTKVQEMQDILTKYLNYTPLQYLLGYTYFYGYKFKVNDKVLIPRFDTENLVELVLKKYNDVSSLIDVGTGSGNIAVVLAKKLKKCHVYASDISTEALEIAKKNAKENEADITFYAGDLLEPFIQNDIHVPLIVSNPPYVALDDKEVGSFVAGKEPALAIYARSNGLEVYERILKQVPSVLEKHGIMILEIGYKQAKDVTKLAKKYLGQDILVNVYQDINGLDRVIEIIKENGQ